MLKDVEHENEGIPFAGPESLIEGSNVDAFTKGVVRPDHIPGQFDSLHIAKFCQFAEKQPVSATHVKNRAPSSGGLFASKKIENHLFARAEPPVILVQLSVALAEFWVQKEISRLIFRRVAPPAGRGR